MKIITRLIATLITVTILVGFFVIWELYWRGPAKEAELLVFVVEEGSSMNQVAASLHEQDILGNEFLFKLYGRAKGLETKIMAGSFEVYPGDSIKALFSALTEIQEEAEITLTFLEGWTLDQYGEYLEAQGFDSANEFTALVGGSATAPIDETPYVSTLRDQYTWLRSKPTNTTLEGYLFPDTYRVFEDAALTDIVAKLLDNLESKLTDEMMAEISRQGKTIDEIIIMASIIEREVQSEEDKKLVSGIFWQRLEIGMPLQADSTVNYFTGKDTPAISFEDRDTESPYNSYLNPGLPIAPISNPGLTSIEAAIYPTYSDYYYFLTDEEGTVYYARTNDEHAANKARYLR